MEKTIGYPTVFYEEGLLPGEKSPNLIVTNLTYWCPTCNLNVSDRAQHEADQRHKDKHRILTKGRRISIWRK